VTVRFLADEDVRAGIIQGLRSREPAIDILDVKTAGLRGTKDTELLELAAQQGRIVISHDRETMIGYFRERLDSGKSTAGLFVVPQQPGAIREIIESLLLVWAASQAEEWRNQIAYLPFR
jgi:hypothetical protein